MTLFGHKDGCKSVMISKNLMETELLNQTYMCQSFYMALLTQNIFLFHFSKRFQFISSRPGFFVIFTFDTCLFFKQLLFWFAILQSRVILFSLYLSPRLAYKLPKGESWIHSLLWIPASSSLAHSKCPGNTRGMNGYITLEFLSIFTPTISDENICLPCPSIFTLNTAGVKIRKIILV